jgi:hypothetical protein
MVKITRSTALISVSIAPRPLGGLRDRQYLHPTLNRHSEHIPRSLLQGKRANPKNGGIPHGPSSCSLLQGASILCTQTPEPEEVPFKQGYMSVCNGLGKGVQLPFLLRNVS